jgi:hypothetical protein
VLAVIDELPQHRAASFRLLQRLAHQRIGQAQRFLLCHLAHDREVSLPLAAGPPPTDAAAARTADLCDALQRNQPAEAGRIILTVPLALGMIAFVAVQWNSTHVFNPKWHTQARFHAVQLGLFFIALSGIGLWLIWASGIGPPTAAWLAAAVPFVFWSGEFAALLVNGTDPSPDPAHPNTFPLLGMRVHGNLFFAACMIVFSLLGAGLAITG